MAQDFLKIAKAMEMSPPSILFKIELNISNFVFSPLLQDKCRLKMDKPDELWSMKKQDSDF